MGHFWPFLAPKMGFFEFWGIYSESACFCGHFEYKYVKKNFDQNWSFSPGSKIFGRKKKFRLYTRPENLVGDFQGPKLIVPGLKWWHWGQTVGFCIERGVGLHGYDTPTRRYELFFGPFLAKKWWFRPEGPKNAKFGRRFGHNFCRTASFASK